MITGYLRACTVAQGCYEREMGRALMPAGREGADREN